MFIIIIYEIDLLIIILFKRVISIYSFFFFLFYGGGIGRLKRLNFLGGGGLFLNSLLCGDCFFLK